MAPKPDITDVVNWSIVAGLVTEDGPVVQYSLSLSLA